MRYIFLTALVLLGGALSGCNPTFNWRELRLQDSALVALLPCKPDRGARRLTLGAQEIELQMMGCEAGGALFAVSHAELRSPDDVLPVLAKWKAAMLLNMHAETSSKTPFTLKGATLLPQSERMVATGRRADGSVVTAWGVWFASGAHVFHAAVYADKPLPEASETFFSGLKLQ